MPETKQQPILRRASLDPDRFLADLGKAPPELATTTIVDEQETDEREHRIATTFKILPKYIDVLRAGKFHLGVDMSELLEEAIEARVDVWRERVKKRREISSRKPSQYSLL